MVPLVYLYHFRVNEGKNIVPSSAQMAQKAAIENWLEYTNPSQLLAKITIPTLILCGLSDILVPPVNSRIIEEKISSSILKEYHKGGHAMLYQYPRELADEIKLFLKV